MSRIRDQEISPPSSTYSSGHISEIFYTIRRKSIVFFIQCHQEQAFSKQDNGTERGARSRKFFGTLSNSIGGLARAKIYSSKKINCYAIIVGHTKRQEKVLMSQYLL